jgi:hypothetical protein
MARFLLRVRARSFLRIYLYTYIRYNVSSSLTWLRYIIPLVRLVSMSYIVILLTLGHS